MPLPNGARKYTYEDYCQWPDEERWELIDGVPYDMTAAPGFDHQTMVGNLFAILKNKLRGKPCIPIVSPFDVILSETNVVEPDIVVVCDRNKIKDKNMQGAPDIVIEILSPSTTKKDRWYKKNLYEKFGVREYIIVDPPGQYVERYLLQDGHFDKGEMFDLDQSLVIRCLDNLEIPVADIFAMP